MRYQKVKIGEVTSRPLKTIYAPLGFNRRISQSIPPTTSTRCYPWYLGRKNSLFAIGNYLCRLSEAAKSGHQEVVSLCSVIWRVDLQSVNGINWIYKGRSIKVTHNTLSFFCNSRWKARQDRNLICNIGLMNVSRGEIRSGSEDVVSRHNDSMVKGPLVEWMKTKYLVRIRHSICISILQYLSKKVLGTVQRW